MAGGAKPDFIISMEGIGSSGKTTQLSLLAESLRADYNVTAHKIISRKLLENALKPLSSGKSERIWVANLPNVEIGVDLLAFLALYTQRYSIVKSEVGAKPHIFIIERYLYSPFTHVAARAVLKEIAGQLGSDSFEPGVLAEIIARKSAQSGTGFNELAEKYKKIGLKNASGKIDSLYKAFVGASGIVVSAGPGLHLGRPGEVDKTKGGKAGKQGVYRWGCALLHNRERPLQACFEARAQPHIRDRRHNEAGEDNVRNTEDCEKKVQSQGLQKIAHSEM